MKSAKKARLLSIFLTTALVIGSLPSALGIIASADGTAIDYSAVVNQTHLKINDYYSNLKMYDGVGLEVSNGTVVTDKDWYGQLANGDADVKASGAYAVYNILPGSAFSADFTDTTAIGKMKIYFSEDMVDWFLADTVAVGKTLTVAKTPDYAKYAKIQWPTSSSEKNGLKSVTLTAGEKYAADKRIDYAVNALDGAVQNGIDSDSYLVKYGIWNTSDNLYYFDSGIIQPDYSGIENTTDENPFDGYVVYKAQPGTHFGLTVTSDRAASQFAELLGKAPLDWKVEIYGSLDGVNYRALNIDPVYSARYSNSFNPEDPDDGTRRSADYNFIVPDDVVFIKCKFPQTKDLSSLNKDEIAGNDLFEINRVEFTQLKYDYCKLSNDDYYITDGTGGTVPASAYAKLGISETNGDFQRLTDEASRCLIDPTWGQQYYNKGRSKATVIYAVEPGTPFYLGFKSIGSKELNKYIKDFAAISGGKFTLIVNGCDSETELWSQIGEITITVENSGVQFFTFALTAEENKYSGISVRWPELVDDTCAGNSILGIAEAYLTLPQATTITEKTDFTKVSGYGGVNSKNDFVGAVDWSKNHIPYIDKNGIGGDWSYLDSHATAGEKPYVTWEVEGGQKVTFNFATQGSKYIDFYGSNIKVYTSATLDFAESSEYPLTNSEGNAYVCSLTVPENHKYVKVVLPQDRKYNKDDAANQAFLIKSMTKEVLPIEKTDFTKVSGYGGVNSKNDFVGAVDWSKNHIPYIDGTGIGGDWGYLDARTDAGEKPYVTWEVEGGQKVTFNFATQGSKYIDFYGSNIKVYTSATLDFAENSEYSLADSEGNTYVCTLTVPENHKYVKVVLPQDRKYNKDDAANQAFLIKSMKVQTVGTKTEKTVKTVTGIKTVSNGTVTVIGDNIAAAGIVIEVTYADGEVRRTDYGCTYSGFDAENPNEQQITVSYKGFTDTATVVTLRSGDFNKDGNVDILDYVRLKKIIVGQAESDGADPDLNGDGSVNATDLAIMRRFLIGAIASL